MCHLRLSDAGSGTTERHTACDQRGGMAEVAGYGHVDCGLMDLRKVGVLRQGTYEMPQTLNADIR